MQMYIHIYTYLYHRCTKLEWLELRACGRLSDGGIKFVGMLAAKQTKARLQWENRPPGCARMFTETKKHSPNTGARANNTLQVTRPPQRGAY